jgi:hypothetical protein
MATHTQAVTQPGQASDFRGRAETPLGDAPASSEGALEKAARVDLPRSHAKAT